MNSFLSALPRHCPLLPSPPHHTPAFGVLASDCRLLQHACPSLVFHLFLTASAPSLEGTFESFHSLCLTVQSPRSYFWSAPRPLPGSFSCTCPLTLVGLQVWKVLGCVLFLSQSHEVGSVFCKLLGIIREWVALPSTFGQKPLSFSGPTPHLGSIHLPHPLLSSSCTLPTLPLLPEEAVCPTYCYLRDFSLCSLPILSYLRSRAWGPASRRPHWPLSLSKSGASTGLSAFSKGFCFSLGSRRGSGDRRVNTGACLQ